MLDGASILLIVLAFVVAGLVKGAIGMGLPAVAIGVLSLTMAPAHAAALLIVPSFATNIWQMLAGPHLRPLAWRLWPMMLGICAGAWAGLGLLAADKDGHAVIALGGALMIYALFGLSGLRPSVPPRAEFWLAPIVGAATGFITAGTGVFVIPAVPYLQALGLQRDVLVQALGLYFTIATLALAAILLHGGFLGTSLALPSLIALGAALCGMPLGVWLRSKIAPAAFQRYFLFGLLALGAHLALRRLL